VVFRLGDGNEPSTNIMSDGQPAPDVICVAKEAVALHHGEEACGSRVVIPANYRGQARSRVGPATAGGFSATNGGIPFLQQIWYAGGTVTRAPKESEDERGLTPDCSGSLVSGRSTMSFDGSKKQATRLPRLVGEALSSADTATAVFHRHAGCDQYRPHRHHRRRGCRPGPIGHRFGCVSSRNSRDSSRGYICGSQFVGSRGTK
jgi:hypothetical protein